MDSFQSRQALPVFITGQKMQCMICEDDDDDLKRKMMFGKDEM